MFLDHWGLIVQRDFDGGDSLQRHGSWVLTYFIQLKKGLYAGRPIAKPTQWNKAVELFECAPGIYRRHPDPDKWYSNPDTTSRDQLVPVIITLGLLRDYKRLWRLEWNIVKRVFFSQNVYRNWDPVATQKKKIPDTFIGHLGVLIRAWGWFALPLYPLLLVLDLIDLVGTLIEAIPFHFADGGKLSRRDADDADDMNGVNARLQSLAVLPTPFSWASRKLYSALRAPTYGCKGVEDATRFPESPTYNETNRVMGALVWYNRTENGGNDEMSEAYRLLIEKYF